MDVETFMENVRKRNPGQLEFHQAVEEVAHDVLPFMDLHAKYRNQSILERLTEPDRVISFRVAWEDDQGVVQVNRGFRVQFNNSIGPYKGGLRFHESVRLSILKFLAFEQVFKNALTTLPLGGAKGGSNFNPKGKSDSEIMRFCQSFMIELSRYIGKDRDIPAGDIGVGIREIGYLFGQYKRLKNEFTGTMTGKKLTFGGSPIRIEATGYGCVYFAREMLDRVSEDIDGKVCLVSGSGNVAQYAVEKLIQMGGQVVAMSDSKGTLHVPDGFDAEKLKVVSHIKNEQRGTLQDCLKHFDAQYLEGRKPWHISCDAAFPCATQNEIDIDDAQTLIKNGCQLVSEGANMPATSEAARLFRDQGLLYGPGKAANAGGVAISGLEMTQNSMYTTWERDEVDHKLQDIMHKIHNQCVEYGEGEKGVDYVKGANIASFIKVSDAMIAYGCI
jgi:glutamate dehydrogenase (NADP+)